MIPEILEIEHAADAHRPCLRRSLDCLTCFLYHFVSLLSCMHFLAYSSKFASTIVELGLWLSYEEFHEVRHLEYLQRGWWNFWRHPRPSMRHLFDSFFWQSNSCRCLVRLGNMCDSRSEYSSSRIRQCLWLMLVPLFCDFQMHFCF